MKLIYAAILAAIVFFSGCAPEVRPENMTPDQKRVVYQSVQDEIEYLTNRGDVLYETGYYADAASAFERVNFYEDRAVISEDKIKKIRIRAQANGKHYYNKAVGYLKQGKKKDALYSFNRMMRNDSDYKDGKARFEALKNDPEIKPFLAQLEADLNNALLANKGTAKDVAKVDKALSALIDYDDTSAVAKQAAATIETQRSALVNEAVRIYNQGNLDAAADKFRLILSIYQKDHTSDRYLAKILSKREQAMALKRAQSELKKAQDALKAQDYVKAIELAQAVLDVDAKNSDAKKILNEAKAEQEKQIPDLIAKGKAFYNKQDFKNAKAMFQSVLVFDPDDNTSLTYIKKIDRQLETIESLK